MAKCPLIVKKVKLKMGATGNSRDLGVESAMSVRGAHGQVGHSKGFLGDLLKVERRGNKDGQRGGRVYKEWQEGLYK